MKQLLQEHSLSLSNDLNRKKNYWFLTSLQWIKQIEFFFSYKILCNFAVKGYTCNQKYKTLAEVDKIGSAGQAFSAKPDKLSWMPGTNMAEEI